MCYQRKQGTRWAKRKRENAKPVVLFMSSMRILEDSCGARHEFIHNAKPGISRDRSTNSSNQAR